MGGEEGGMGGEEWGVGAQGESSREVGVAKRAGWVSWSLEEGGEEMSFGLRVMTGSSPTTLTPH